MKRARVRACLAAGAVAAAITAAAVGAVPPPPVSAGAVLNPTAQRDAGIGVTPGSEGHEDSQPTPSPKPTQAPPADDSDAHGRTDPMPSAHADEHEEPMPSDQMEAMPSGHMDEGHDVPGATGAPSGDPHGHGASTPDASHGVDPHSEPDPAASGAPDGHGTTDEHGMATDDDGEDGGHGEKASAEPKPREAILGGFGLLNAGVLAAAAITRRRDRAKANAMASTPTRTARKDASR